MDAITDPQSKDVDLLMLKVQMEMLNTQKKMLKRWASIDLWITIIGMIILAGLVFSLVGSCHAW